MLRVFIIVFIAFCCQLLSADGFKFRISRDLSNTGPLNETNWSYVEITENENDTVTVKVDVPIHLNYSDIFVFFANNAKEILQVKLNETVQGTFYSIPYKKTKEMTSETASKFEEDSFTKVSGNFPREWLPKNVTKISGTIVGSERYFNSYGIQNFNISFPDLMVVEEFENYTQN